MTPRSKRPDYAARYNKLHSIGHRTTVDATVTRRMLQALRAIGYSSLVMSEALGWGEHWVRDLTTGRVVNNHTAQSVHVSTANRVAAFYWAHHMKPRTGRGAQRCINAARAAGWPSPMAYDDITNPHEAPKGVIRA